jgi:hypothetical protein
MVAHGCFVFLEEAEEDIGKRKDIGGKAYTLIMNTASR